MTLSDGVHAAVHGNCRGPVPGLWRRGRAGPRAIGLICVLAAGALAGCGMSEGPGTFAVDPGRYSVYHCNDLVARLNALLTQEKDLRNLMDKASEGTGGTVIGTLSYRTDYEAALSEEKLLRRTAAEKNCELASPPYQSDQTIR
jgi:hypothetical protein